MAAWEEFFLSTAVKVVLHAAPEVKRAFKRTYDSEMAEESG
jgi:hypothetical protein